VKRISEGANRLRIQQRLVQLTNSFWLEAMKNAVLPTSTTTSLFVSSISNRLRLNSAQPNIYDGYQHLLP